MEAKKRIQAVHLAELRVLRALRLAMTAMHDIAIGDVFTIAGHEPDQSDPAQPARTKAWNVTGALILSAGEALEALHENPSVGECCVRDVLKECEVLIQLKEKEIRDERDRPFMEKLEGAVEEKKRQREAGPDASGSEK